MNDQAYEQWLEQSASAERCLLIMLESNEGSLCVGWPSFISRPDDNISNWPFDDVLSELPEFLGNESFEVGDLEIVWPNQINELFSLHWKGYRFRIYLGAQAWAMDDFRIIATGHIESVERTSAHHLKFNFLNASALFSKAIKATVVEPTETIDLSFIAGNEPRDFRVDRLAFPLPQRDRWESSGVTFPIHLLQNGWQ